MARAVYSTRFLAFLGTGAPAETYTVPAGYVGVLREMTAFLRVGDLVYVTVDVDGVGVPVWQTFGTESSGSTFNWSSRAVMPPGSILNGSTNSAEASSLYASGYLLTV